MITEKQRVVLQALADRDDWSRAGELGGVAHSRHGGVLANLYDLHLIRRRPIKAGGIFEYRINAGGTEALFDHAQRVAKSGAAT